MISISPFILSKKNSESIYQLFTPIGATNITHESLVSALNDIKKVNKIINESEIDNILSKYNLPIDSAKNFLININLIKKNDNSKKVTIFCKSSKIGMELSNLIINNDAVMCNYSDNIDNIHDSNIIIAIQDKYSQKEAKKIYSLCRENTSSILCHSYFAFRHFIIDGFYCDYTNLPDHFSGLHNISGIEQTSETKPHSWADYFFRDPYLFNEIEVPTFEFSNIEIGASLHLLYTRIKSIITSNSAPLYSEDLSTVTEFNLDTGRIDRHKGFHSNFSSSPREI